MLELKLSMKNRPMNATKFVFCVSNWGIILIVVHVYDANTLTVYKGKRTLQGVDAYFRFFKAIIHRIKLNIILALHGFQ